MIENLKVIYRISDKGNPKAKLPNGGKDECLLNAIESFGRENIYVIADNCNQETVAKLKAWGLAVELTSNGNTGTFKYIINEVLEKYNDDEYVYLLEDDYLHLPGAKEILLEGLQIADYVSLYDHPDMYTLHEEGGANPFYHRGGGKCQVYLTAHSHWRTTVSTTMTFAARVKTLKEDREIWNTINIGNIPKDFYSFVVLTKQRDADDFTYMQQQQQSTLIELMRYNMGAAHPDRKLISALPAKATHTEIGLVAPLFPQE